MSRQAFTHVAVVLGAILVSTAVFTLTTAEGLALRRFAYYVGTRHECNICGASLRTFEIYSTTARDPLQCPFCYSRPRHRVAYMYFQQKTNLFDGTPKRMLHIAPEPSLERRFREIPGIDYLSGDLDSDAAMVQMDITDIRYPDSSFDVIYCSHVLEHVPDDRRAMRELARVLKPGGWAVIAVPIIRDRTLEDPAITSPEARTKAYGQWDHVRAYGPDFADRLRESGFDVTVDGFTKGLSEEIVRRHGLSREDVYFLRKAVAKS